ncbi:MAG: TldD/PmbA family protein [Marinibacterium sp.]|nr:TldD/PmbA family protein [Marinibacterium sp.]
MKDALPLSDLAQQMIDAARQAGADHADAIVLRGVAQSVDIRNGTLEQAERAEGTDIGMRVFVGQRQAVTSSSDMSASVIAAMAERAVAMAREAPEDPHAGLATPDQLATGWDLAALDLCDPSDEPAPQALSDRAIAAEDAARAVSGVTQIEGASASYSRTDVHLAASNGFAGGYMRTGHSTSCVAISGQGLGMERDYDGDARLHGADLRDPAEIGHSAGRRAVALQGARKPATGSYPVLFDERIASSLIGHLMAAANGAAIARGGSWLQDALGTQVLPDHLSLIEDPHRPRATGSRPFDADGLPTQRRAVVDKGRLTGWTLDLATARQLGMASTGNAARGVSSPPSPSTWNLELTQGSASRDDLLRDMGRGLLVTSMIGSTINPTTGDYSRGASGFWVEDGQIAYPVNECTIAGNLRDMLRRIIPANDARPYLSRVVPSLLIEGMTLAGD